MSDMLFSKQSVPMYLSVWKRMKEGQELTGDAEMIAEVMQGHSEFDPFWTQGEKAFQPQEIDGYMVNPLVHTGLHVVIEKQLLNQEPEEVVLALNALMGKGFSRHEAIHKLVALWGDLYFRSVRRGNPMEEWTYIEGLKTFFPET